MPTHGRVLIVEDDPAVREVLAEYLGGHGYDVVEADRGTAMREAVERNLPDDVQLARRRCAPEVARLLERECCGVGTGVDGG